ncbi:acetylxylan esterase [Spongiactinospora sp. TRM90649]|uniref:acetylxylan esterase n=1 Tax=Spongiactinospora sp. TRM90649 TaxID=3031114 RepID=UPI0023F9C346|nr:acetylxylan esterase [Spongiactinospora sp. TRM90649]MDF5757000.1 acetylxylan esterase [Spongiactinospora sp. TRM90649]
MALFDMPLAELRGFAPPREEPAGFEEFWAETLANTREHPLDPELIPQDVPLDLVDVAEVRFSGFGGHRIGGWFIRPRGLPGPLPCAVRYLGYSIGRGHPHQWLDYPAAGFATLVMDTRGQGGGSGTPGYTADPAGGGGPEVAGFLTRGLNSPEDYYYRRVYADAVRAVETAAALPGVDPGRILVAGGSQGGGIALAVAGLAPGLPRAVLLDVPSLALFRRATEISNVGSRAEIAEYLRTHRRDVDEVFGVLAHFDGVHFAARATAPAWFSVALMDQVCPPSTVFAAYNHYAGPKEITVWPYNGHEGGGGEQEAANLALARRIASGGKDG